LSSSLYSSLCHSRQVPPVYILYRIVLWTCTYTRHQNLEFNHNSMTLTIQFQPTGIALTPVPHSFDRPLFPVFKCFRPPRCFPSSSSSFTVHVRLPAAACSIPEVVENRCGRCGNVEASSSLLLVVVRFS